MKVLLNICGILLILGGVILGWAILIEQEQLEAALDYKQAAGMGYQALGFMLGGVIASLPYFALARLLPEKPTAPEVPDQGQSSGA